MTWQPGNPPSKSFNNSRIELPHSSKYLSETIYEWRRRLGQCFRCGKKYTLRHQCRIKGIHMIKELEEDKKEFVDMK